MREASNYSPIRPELVAKKLDQIRNFEHPTIHDEMLAQPRLAEVLWFLTFVSRNENHPGGLRKFSSDLIAQSTDLLGTKTMQKHGSPPYPAALHEAISDEIPHGRKWDVQFVDDDELQRLHGKPLEGWELEEMSEAAQQREAAAALRKMMAGDVVDHCKQAADGDLTQYLVSLCESPEVQFGQTRQYASRGGAPWYFVRIADAILRFIDRRKAEIAGTIAETDVSKEIFKWLGKARSTNRSIVISGNSRFGKTEAVRAWAAMNPGLARIVETPASGGEGELLRAICKALGIEIGARQRGHELRGQVEFVLQQFRPVLIFEEASFLYPVNFSKNTMPARLNWVRRSVMDAGIPCAFVWIPQTHSDARNRFLKATNFAIQQFDGRILRTVNLPDEIPREDLMAIARIHFRNLPDDYCEYVVSKAAATERNFCSDISNIAALAYSNAEDAGRTLPNLGDIKAAIADVLPTAAELPEEPARKIRKRSESPLHASCKPRETLPPGVPEGADSGIVEHSDLSPRSRPVSPVVLSV